MRVPANKAMQTAGRLLAAPDRQGVEPSSLDANRGRVSVFDSLSPTQRELLRLLTESGVRFVVIGGYAMRFHGRDRPAKDLDLFVPRDRATVSQLAALLAKVGRFPAEVVQTKLEKPGSQLRWHDVEILTSIETLDFDDVAKRAETSFVDVKPVPVVSAEDLAAAKRVANRREDRDDTLWLEQKFGV